MYSRDKGAAGWATPSVPREGGDRLDQYLGVTLLRSNASRGALLCHKFSYSKKTYSMRAIYDAHAYRRHRERVRCACV